MAALEARGLAVYVDREEIVDFEGIRASIERGLVRSKALLAFYSPRYATRRPCQWELTTAFLAAQRRGDPRQRVLIIDPERRAGHIQLVELQDALFRVVSAGDDAREPAALAEGVAAHVAQLDRLVLRVIS